MKKKKLLQPLQNNKYNNTTAPKITISKSTTSFTSYTTTAVIKPIIKTLTANNQQL